MKDRDYSKSGLAKSPEVYRISSQLANKMLKMWHYLGPVYGIKFAYGHTEGCLVFTNLRARKLEEKLRQIDLKPIELARMCGMPGHTWAMSSLMSKSIKLLKKDSDTNIIITYADPFAKHDGMVYKANNWIFDCDSSSELVIYLDNRRISRRTLYDMCGTSSIPILEEIYGNRLDIKGKIKKKRFVFFLNKKAQKLYFQKYKGRQK